MGEATLGNMSEKVGNTANLPLKVTSRLLSLQAVQKKSDVLAVGRQRYIARGAEIR